MKASLKVNGVILEIESNKFKDVIRTLSLLQGTPTKCDNCDTGAKLLFNHRGVKKQSDGKMCDYYGIICTGCGASKNLHFRQNEEQTPYWKWDEKFSKYERSVESQQQQQQNTSTTQNHTVAPANNVAPVVADVPPVPATQSNSDEEIPF